MLRGIAVLLAGLLAVTPVAAHAAGTVQNGKTDLSVKSLVSPKTDLESKRSQSAAVTLYGMGDAAAPKQDLLPPGTHQVPREAIVTRG